MPEPWLLVLCAGVSILGTSAGARVLERLDERRFNSLGRILVLGIGSVYLLLGAQRILH
jgi:uncharacterized membrane protein YfcA